MALFVVCFVVASWTDAIDVFQRRITGSGNFFWLRVVFARGWRSSRLIDLELLPAASHNGGRNESVRGDRMSLGGERMVKWIFGRVLIKGEVKYLFALPLLWVWHMNQNYPEQGRVPQLVTLYISMKYCWTVFYEYVDFTSRLAGKNESKIVNTQKLTKLLRSETVSELYRDVMI